MKEDELMFLHGIRKFVQNAKSLSYDNKENERKSSTEYFTAGNAPESSVVMSNCFWIATVLQNRSLRLNDIESLTVVTVYMNHYAKKHGNFYICLTVHHEYK